MYHCGTIFQLVITFSYCHDSTITHKDILIHFINTEHLTCLNDWFLFSNLPLTLKPYIFLASQAEVIIFSKTSIERERELSLNEPLRTSSIHRVGISLLHDRPFK